MLDQLAGGFAVALSAKTLLYSVLGCLCGTIVGVLPGLGPLAGMTLLLPLTFGLDPTTGITMLAGIFCGAMYGGSTTSILVRMPGEAASLMTCLDGYAMTQQNRAGPALMIAAVGSFVGGTLAILGLSIGAPLIASVVLKIGPAEEFVLTFMALLLIAVATPGPWLKTATMLVAGLLLGAVGLDSVTGEPRFTFGLPSLADGFSFAALAIGLFGIAELLRNLESVTTIAPVAPRMRDLVPRWSDLREAAPAIGRGSLVGLVLGVIPGVSHIASTFAAYSIEKRLAREPHRFGNGAMEGVAAPESANNAATGTSLVPLLALGVPSIPATALLLSALTIHGVQPGPLLFQNNPEVFWGLVASLYVANIVLLILNLPLVGLFVNLLRIPYPWLVPIVLIIAIIGAYSTSFSILDIWTLVLAGGVGYILQKFDYPLSPLLLALVLGDRLEENFRLSLIMSGGSYATFAEPGPLVILCACLGILLALHLLARFSRSESTEPI